MTAPMVLACLWVIAAKLIAMFPSRDNHWRAAYALIALGLPLAAWIWASYGPLWALGFVLAAGNVLRWPVYYGWKWVAGRVMDAGRPS